MWTIPFLVISIQVPFVVMQNGSSSGPGGLWGIIAFCAAYIVVVACLILLNSVILCIRSRFEVCGRHLIFDFMKAVMIILNSEMLHDEQGIYCPSKRDTENLCKRFSVFERTALSECSSRAPKVTVTRVSCGAKSSRRSMNKAKHRFLTVTLNQQNNAICNDVIDSCTNM